MNRWSELIMGSVRVRVRCRFPERVLNICGVRDISVREPVFAGQEELLLSVSRGDWKRLKAACGDLDAEAQILRTAGIPFFIGRLRRRYALLAGLAVCAALLALSACFVWDLQVQGNETTPEERILRVLARNGVRRGTFVFSIDQRTLRNHALLELPELSWLTVNVRGCRAEVVVRERIPRPEIVNERAPTNVVASRDALVTEVRALDGEARVLKGTTVRKGQLLISGIVETRDVTEPSVKARFLAGKGEVYGRTWYELSAMIPLYREVKHHTGEEKHAYAVLWGDNRVKFGRIEGSNIGADCDKIINRTQWRLPGGLVLPVTWVRETYLPFETEREERTREEAQELGRSVLERDLLARLGETGTLVRSRCAGAVRGDWLLVTLSAECVEQIGLTVPIPVE